MCAVQWRFLAGTSLAFQAVVSVQENVTDERVQKLKQRFMSAYDVTADGKLQIQEVKYTFFLAWIVRSFTWQLFPSYWIVVQVKVKHIFTFIFMVQSTLVTLSVSPHMSSSCKTSPLSLSLGYQLHQLKTFSLWLPPYSIFIIRNGLPLHCLSSRLISSSNHFLVFPLSALHAWRNSQKRAFTWIKYLFTVYNVYTVCTTCGAHIYQEKSFMQVDSETLSINQTWLRFQHTA